jgi:hypothetical protein
MTLTTLLMYTCRSFCNTMELVHTFAGRLAEEQNKKGAAGQSGGLIGVLPQLGGGGDCRDFVP